MQAEPFFATLRRILNPVDCPLVIKAARQDELVWSALSDPEIFRNCLNSIPANAAEWTPAAIGISLLKEIPKCTSLQAEPMVSVSPEYRKLAAHTYEEAVHNGVKPANLEQAVILSLALRERRRHTGSWQGLPIEITITNDASEDKFIDLWRTPLACLYGMVPDPAGLLAAFSECNGLQLSTRIEIILHIIFSQPGDEDDRSSALTPILVGSTRKEQMLWLQQLEEMGQNNVANHLAASFLNSVEDGSRPDKVITASDYAHSNIPAVFTNKLSDLDEMRRTAELYALAGQPGKAANILHQVSEGLRCVYSRVLADAASMSGQAGDAQSAIAYSQKSLDVAPELETNRTELAALLNSSGQYDDALQIINTGPATLPGLLISTRAAYQGGDVEAARHYAFQVVNALRQGETAKPAKDISSTLPDFIDLLVDLDMPEEAYQVAASILKNDGHNVELNSAMSRAATACNMKAAAREHAQLALALAPKNLELRRNLAAAHELNEDWAESLQERQAVLQSEAVREKSDLLSLARCSLESGNFDNAVLLCEEVYLQDSENGLAHAIHGRALQKQGNLTSAVEHYQQAAAISPELPSPWLALSEILEEQGDHRRALETLRAGAHASPASAEIHHALAESCLQNGAPSEALPALRKAAQLDPDSARIAIRLGDILRSLGHLEESSSVLSRAMRYSSNDAELAYELAKTSIAAGATDNAIAALEIKLASKPNDPEPYILYTRLILESQQNNPGTVETSCRLKQAEDALITVLSNHPDHNEAGILNAEVLTAAGRTEEALDCYKALAEQYQDKSIAWSWRIKLGLGKAALNLGQHDAALAAMQEAASLNPGNVSIQKTLAETYLAANLIKEAIQAGRNALHISGDDFQFLMWFAGLACTCGSYNDAISALENAAEKAGGSLEPHLRLAQVELLASNPPAARSALSLILHNTGSSAETLRQAAHLYLLAGDPEAAEECLLKATELNSGIEAWIELAVVQKEFGKKAAALETAQTGIALYSADARLHFLEADLLATFERFDEGLVSLARIAPSELKQPVTTSIEKHLTAGFPPIPAPQIFRLNTDAASVLAKSGSLLRRKGDLHAALEKTLAALEIQPDAFHIRYQAVSTAHALLDLDLAYSLAADAVGNGSILSVRYEPEESSALLCKMAELEIEMGCPEDAAQSTQKSEELTPGLPSALLLKAQLSGICGNFIGAEDYLETAIRRLDSSPTQTVEIGLSGEDKRPKQTIVYPALSIAKSAVLLYQWGLAMPLFEQALRTNPNEPQSHLAFASALVLANEAVSLAKLTRIKNHLPSGEYIGQSGATRFEKEIEAASSLCTSPQIDHWRRRGQTLFHASGYDPTLSEPLCSAESSAQSHLWALAETGSFQELIETAKGLPELPGILLPYALALLPDHPEQSLILAKKLAGQSPDHPVYQAAMAIIATEANDEVEGLQAIEQALQIWPDEPEWHVLAAKLSKSCGDSTGELRHWEQAHQMSPNDVDNAISLGIACLNHHNIDRGMEVLEEAANSNPENPDTWLALARACLAGEDLERAFTCAEKASILAPERCEPRLISGQIALQAVQLPAARMHAQAVLQRDPGESQAMLILVKSLLAEGQKQSALAFIEKSVQNARDPYPLQYERVALLKSLVGIDAAIEALEILVEEYPREAVLYRDLAELQAASDRHADAENSAQAALRLQPYQPELHHLVGSLQRSSGQLDQAIYHLSEAIHQNPDYLEAYLELGKAYQDRREYDLAQNVYQQGMAAAPGDHRPYFCSALLLKESKDYIGAEKMLRKAASLSPDDVNIRRQLGAIVALNLVHNPMEVVK